MNYLPNKRFTPSRQAGSKLVGGMIVPNAVMP